MIGLRNVWICACDRRCQTQGRPKRTSKEVKLGGYEKGKINKEDALVCSKWRVLIRGTVTVGYTDDSGGLLYSFLLLLVHMQEKDHITIVVASSVQYFHLTVRFV